MLGRGRLSPTSHAGLIVHPVVVTLLAYVVVREV